MIIQSDYLTEGLFGQIFVWMLEVLPYVDAQSWKPEWRIRTKNFGQPPTFNIFPGIVQQVYNPETNGEIQSLEQLQHRHKFNFKNDFKRANKYWNSHFRFTADVHDRLNSFWETNFSGKTVLGVHYRGTDKNVDTWQANPVSRYQFLCVVEDFLKSHPDVTAIFVASDDAKFIEAMRNFSNARFFDQHRSEDGRPLWNQQKGSGNEAASKDAILDSLTLARCRYGLKCMSQLSAFSKVINPELEIYRVSACKPGWFPEAYVPLYRSADRAAQSLLNTLQEGDFQAPPLSKILALPRRLSGIAEQWQRRGTHVPLISRLLSRK